MTKPARLGPGFLAGFIIFSLTVASQFVAATYGGAAAPPPVLPAAVPEADRGRLRIVGGIPVARLSGTPREMGRQHGVIFKEQIRFLYREYCEAMVMRAVGREKLEAWAKSTEPFIPEAYKEEMRGIAESVGFSYEKVLLCNTMVDRFQTLFCSTVVAAGDATRDKEIYFGRNLDFPGRNLLHRMTVVIVWEPDGGEPVASVTWPGLIGILSGMNAHGVAGATMLIHRGKELQAGMPYPMMYRQALSRARKTGDVYDAIVKTTRTCPNNFMVVDGTGTAEVIEFDRDTVARRAAEKGCVCSTNHFRTEALADEGFAVGVGRYDTLAEFLERERGRIDVDRIQKALADVATPWFNNVQSMVFLPARRSLYLSVGGKLPAAKQPFVHLPRDVLFGKAGQRK